MIVAIDPGLRGCGVAVFGPERKALVRAGYVKNPNDGRGPGAWCAMAWAVEAWLAHGYTLRDTSGWIRILERPVIYPERDNKNPNDVAELCGVLGAIATLWSGAIHTYDKPRDWKGTIDGEDFIRDRIMPAVTPAERERIEFPRARALSHNVWDAIGIGLKYLGRLEPRRVFPR